MNINTIKLIINNEGWSRGVAIATKGPKKELLDSLIELTLFLNDHYNKVYITQRAWHITNDNYELQKCPVCNIKNVGWQNNVARYAEYCSNKCLANSKEVKLKKEAIALDKYGVSCSFLNENQKKKRSKTIKERYGVDFPSQNEEIKGKVKQTNKTRHGSEWLLTSKDYHTSIQNKRFSTTGVKYAPQLHINVEKLKLLYDKEWLIEQHHIKKYTLSYIASLLGVHDSTIGVRFREFDIEIKNYYSSVGQLELEQFVINLDNQIKTNIRTIISPYELDIYSNKHNIGIEFNGLYWHSEINKSNDYHYKKLKKCRDKGIRLIQILESEWLQNKELIKKKISNIFGLNNDHKIYARNTKITNVTIIDKKTFFDTNHIQGDGPSSINYGLEYENRLVAVIGFIKNKDGSFILNRYATSCNVTGGFTKLLAHFEREYNYPKIITFADLRWSEGELYYNSGFIMEKELKADYYWMKGTTVFHKSCFRHSGMKKKLIHYDPNLSETDNMHNHGYYKIYDAGKLRFVKNS